MPKLTLDTVVMQEWLDRWRAGDRDAADSLLRVASTRLAKLTRRMIRTFPRVREFADIEDVIQNSLMRLLRTLQILRPATTRDFFNLAAVHIRRELIDLARQVRRKPIVTIDMAASDGPGFTEPIAPIAPEADRWVRFHEAVDQLPVEEREVVGLIFYHGWTQARIAELFQVAERTIRRRWASACVRLKELMGSEMTPD